MGPSGRTHDKGPVDKNYPPYSGRPFGLSWVFGCASDVPVVSDIPISELRWTPCDVCCESRV